MALASLGPLFQAHKLQHKDFKPLRKLPLLQQQKKQQQQHTSNVRGLVTALASASDDKSTRSLATADYGEPISLGTAKLPKDIDLPKLQLLLFQWATSLTQNANMPLEVPLKVDKVEGGLRLTYIRVTDGAVEDLVYIEITVAEPSQACPQPLFLAERNGKLKNTVPPGEPAIMRSLLEALKVSINMARSQS